MSGSQADYVQVIHRLIHYTGHVWGRFDYGARGWGIEPEKAMLSDVVAVFGMLGLSPIDRGLEEVRNLKDAIEESGSAVSYRTVLSNGTEPVMSDAELESGTR